MAPPKKRARTSPATTTASSPLASTPAAVRPPPSAGPSTPIASFSPDPWTPAQETALYKLLIHHKPTGIHRHFNMLNIHSSLRSQGLTHTRPSKSVPAQPIEHMLPQNIWHKLSGLFDLDTLDEREEHHRLSNESRESSAGSDSRDTPVSQREEWQFTKEFALDGAAKYPSNVEQTEDFAMRMFGRRLKTGSEPASSPPLEERSIADDVSSTRGKGRGAVKAARNNLKPGAPVGARRGSRTTTATTSTAGDDDDENVEEARRGDSHEVAADKPIRSVRGSTRDSTKRGKGRKKRG